MRTLVVIIIVTTVSAWISTFLMRRRMRRALGRKVRDAELLSLTTWMKVDEAERKENGDKLFSKSPPGEIEPESLHAIGHVAETVAETIADKVEDIDGE